MGGWVLMCTTAASPETMQDQAAIIPVHSNRTVLYQEAAETPTASVRVMQQAGM